jgi:16S rRNA (guanine527-N7)-methyltransferase
LVEFKSELERYLPADLPEREKLVELGARHLEQIAETNRQFNLTRITDAKEAAIKHVFDSVMPWRLFSTARQVLDAGTGAGFPGIPLAIVLPSTRFTLAESIQKKARFVAAAVEMLGLANVAVDARRAEDLAGRGDFDVITARAVAPLERALKLFGAALRNGARLLLYKGPDAADEIAAAGADLRRLRATAEIVLRYELPEAMGSRTIVEVFRSSSAGKSPGAAD